MSNDSAALFHNPWSTLSEAGTNRDVIFSALEKKFRGGNDDKFLLADMTSHSLTNVKTRLTSFAKEVVALPALQDALEPGMRSNGAGDALDGYDFVEIGSGCLAFRDKTFVRNLVIIDTNNDCVSSEDPEADKNSYKWFTTGNLPSDKDIEGLVKVDKAVFDYSSATSKSERFLRSQNHRSSVFTIVMHVAHDLATIVYADHSGISLGGPFRIQEGTFFAYNLLFAMVALQELTPLIFQSSGPMFQFAALPNTKSITPAKKIRKETNFVDWTKHFVNDPSDETEYSFYPQSIPRDGDTNNREVVLFDNVGCNNIWERVVATDRHQTTTVFKQSSWELLHFNLSKQDGLSFSDPYQAQSFLRYIDLQRVQCMLEPIPGEMMTSNIEFDCYGIEKLMGTRVRSEKVAWARVNRSFPFLPTPAIAYAPEAVSNSKTRQVLIRGFHDILLSRSPGDKQTAKSDQHISCLASPYTCMIIQEDQTASKNWSFIAPVNSRHPIPLVSTVCCEAGGN